MGGAVRIVKKVVSKPKPPPSSPIVERRAEVAKQTEAEGKKVTRRLKKRTRRRSQLMATSQNTGLETGSDYSPIRNPRDSGSKLGSA